MDWAELERHFLAATEPEGEREPNVIEWDHARYERALGASDEPGLHELRSTGCAVLGLPPTRWDFVRQRYGAWADGAGWRVVDGNQDGIPQVDIGAFEYQGDDEW